MAVTDTRIRKAKQEEKPYRLSDGGGLYLQIAVSGGKLWRWKYRIDGKEKPMALGKYPDVSLAQARERHARARQLLAVRDAPCRNSGRPARSVTLASMPATFLTCSEA